MREERVSGPNGKREKKSRNTAKRGSYRASGSVALAAKDMGAGTLQGPGGARGKSEGEGERAGEGARARVGEKGGEK